MNLRSCLVLLLLAGPALAAAQPAAPAAAPVQPLPRRAEGTFDFSFVSTTGNTDTQSIGLSADTFLRPGAWEIRNRAGFVRATSGDELTTQSLTYLLRAGRKFTPHFSGFGQYDYSRDVFAGIRNRNAVVGGLEYVAVQSSRHTLKTFGGFGYVNEQRTKGATVRSGTFDLGWSYKLKLSSSAEFADDLRGVASFYESRDWRLSHVAAVTTKINSYLSLKVSHSTRYVNYPPEGFDTTDTITAIALVAKF